MSFTIIRAVRLHDWADTPTRGKSGGLNKLITFVFVTVGTALTTVIISYVGEYAFQRINLGVRTKLWNKLMVLPTRHYEGESGDTLVSRITTDASSNYTYFNVVISSVTAIYAAVVSLQQMLKYSPLVSWGFGKLSFIAGKKTQMTLKGNFQRR